MLFHIRLTTKICIEPGNYTHVELITKIQLQFDTINLTSGTTFQIAFDTNTYRVSICNNDIFSLDFRTPVEYPSLGYILGFRCCLYSNKEEYTTSSILNVVGPSYIFLKINNYGRVYISPLQSQKALAKIILTKNKTNVVFDNSIIGEIKIAYGEKPINYHSNKFLNNLV